MAMPSFGTTATFGGSPGGFGAGVGAPQQPPANPNNDMAVTSPPTDGISSLSWSPVGNFLVATSWDKGVRCWEVSANGQTQPKAQITHDAPVLCSAWHHDGTAVYSGGCCKTAKRWDLATNTPTQVAAHDAPIRHLAWIPQMNLLVTGSWDRTLRYWDCRQGTPAHTQQLPERCYALSVTHPLLVVGCADRHLQVFNLTNPQTPYKTPTAPLKHQTRCIANFPDQTGYLVGSIEGRVAVHHVEDHLQSKNFTFKCHRHPSGERVNGQEANDIYAVNSLSFHPTLGTFVTTGADGAYNFWDKDSKHRLKQMGRCAAPIPCGSFNSDGKIYAYAVSYDWSKGADGHDPSKAVNQIYLHACQDTEVKPKQRTSGSGRR